jgi:hypothetical protein
MDEETRRNCILTSRDNASSSALKLRERRVRLWAALLQEQSHASLAMYYPCISKITAAKLMY